MARDRVDALDQRVRRLRAVIEALDAEHDTVREQVRVIESALGDSCSPASESMSTGSPVDSTSSGPGVSGASDAEVAAAVSAIEDDQDSKRDNDPIVL